MDIKTKENAMINEYKYKNIIFDLDGTLLNTLKDLADSVNEVMQSFHYETYSLEQIRLFIGNGIRRLMICAVPKGEENEDFEKAFSLFKKTYLCNCMNSTTVYEGIQDMLKQLHNMDIRIGVVSNKNQEALSLLCQKLLPPYITAVVGQTEGVPKKPAPDMVMKAMDTMGANIGNTLYVGDSEVDIKTAANADIPCASVSWGFRTKDELLKMKPAIIIDTPDELIKYIIHISSN